MLACWSLNKTQGQHKGGQLIGLNCCAGTASAPLPSQSSVLAQSASASTAQQIQATGPAAVAAVRAMQATAAGASTEATASDESTPLQIGGGEVQGLEDEPAAGAGEPLGCNLLTKGSSLA